MSRDINPFGLRMPADLRARVEAAAEKAGRSLNAEIVTRLSEYDDLIGMRSELALVTAKMRQLESENKALYGARSTAAGPLVVDEVRLVKQQLAYLITRLEHADPAFAATRAYFADPKTLDEIYSRRAEEAKRAHAAENEEHEQRVAELKATGSQAKTKKPRSRKRSE
jgi:hypothetical protein